jgi:hypothetical protein
MENAVALVRRGKFDAKAKPTEHQHKGQTLKT